MGEHFQEGKLDKQDRAEFIRQLLTDIDALEAMLDHKLIESDIIRIGAEQEFCLITDHWRPSNRSMAILEDIADEHFTTELARYNLEINLSPLEFQKDCLSRMEKDLHELLNKATASAEKFNNKVLLCGILPTISKQHLNLDYMTPNPRYYRLNDRMHTLRGGDFEVRLRGVDELSIKHDSVLFEACNTSFQTHLQITPDDFVSSYNWAQAIAGPVLGICTNSPLLLGRELWSETRIALFQQSIDTRSSSYALKEQQARVSFGSEWEFGTAADIFKNTIAEHKIILTKEIDKNSLEILSEGKIPKLEALNLHNGTLYRWNRACYGVGNGKPHLRIECRYLPSGPTIKDEMANFAFWAGLMAGRPEEYDDLPSVMDFRDIKDNFIKAARTGKASVMTWNNELISVRDLVINELLPLARKGLLKMNITPDDIDQYLSIIESRAESFNGSQWQIEQFRNLRNELKRDDALVSLTRLIYINQNTNQPVHTWKISDETAPVLASTEIGHIMSTQLLTVNEDDLAAMATRIMEWKNIHHLPVEDNEGKLTGLLTSRHMKRFRQNEKHESDFRVKDIMAENVLTASPETPISKAISIMKKHEFGCLPVVIEQHLIGIITIKDLIPFDNDVDL